MKKNLWKETSNLAKAAIITGGALLTAGTVCAIINARTNGAIEDAAETIAERAEEAAEAITERVADGIEAVRETVEEF